MFLVAITGGIATGKSSVSKIFADNGIPVIDADLIARQFVEPGKSAWRKIRDAFGDIVLNDDGEINRDVLGKMVFSDIQLRRKLNEITHPVIHRTIFFQICQHFMTGRSYIVLDLPLLFETGILLDFIYKIITVTCEEDIQIKRFMDRSLLNEDEAKLRIASQMPLDKKCEKSNFVIENSSEFSKTEKEVLDILTMLNASNHHWRIRSYFLIAVGSVLLLFFWLNRLFNFAPSLNWR